LLAHYFLQTYRDRFGRPELRLSREALDVLMRHQFPGNVRELENIVQAAIALAQGEVVLVEDLRLPGEVELAPAEGAMVELAEVERAHIERVLHSVGGNRSEAARILGIDRTTLYRKLKKNAT
jgi:DNA-binding NtrC family response regulator